VQQVKSKECEHISERLEPFSAVQVEIKGKARLEDSLRAYVEGEVLQGENKYSCTSCGRHVDAVKRACLKDVPDNLIFNLKRFDYDIMTGMRTKVNDEFQFPDTLDIAPYTLDRLADEEQTGEPDWYQLTGVIVHSGTADSGHYYSFIRQRPTLKSAQEAWVQFNDQDVSCFDPSQMRDQCFGGISEAGYYHLPKFYSAYMLFYQRTSSIEKIEQRYCMHDMVNPVRIPLAGPMTRHIAQQNELFLRSYCAQDPVHAQFYLHLLEKMRRGREKCSEDHTLESQTIEMVLEYVHTVSSRFKEVPCVEDTLNLLQEYSSLCSGCARTVADWFRCRHVLEDVIVRSPLQLVRKSFAGLFIRVFSRMHQLATDTDLDDDDRESWATEYTSWLKSCLGQLSALWDFVTKLGRCWPEYFNVLYHIHQLGDTETLWLLDADFLSKFVDMIMMHVALPEFRITGRLKTRYAAYLSARDRNRPFNYQLLIKVFVSVLQRIDLRGSTDEDYNGDDQKIPARAFELQTLGLHKEPPDLEWLRRLIVGKHSPNTQDMLIATFASDTLLSRYLADLVIHGLNDRSINVASSFLRATVVFCQNCSTEATILEVVQVALESIFTVGIEYGKEYFELVDCLYKLENIPCHQPPYFLEDVLLQTISSWAPTLLLAPTEGQSNTRIETADLLQRLLFTPLQDSIEPDSRAFRTYVDLLRDLAGSCVTMAQSTWLNPRSRDSAHLQPGQANQVIEVVEQCLPYFDLENAADEDKVTNMQTVMSQVRIKAESAVENLNSTEWPDNSSELAELSGEDYEDALSP
jgi:ubiquitin carboxyl-terminal hydrolase 34